MGANPEQSVEEELEEEPHSLEEWLSELEVPEDSEEVSLNEMPMKELTAESMTALGKFKDAGLVGLSACGIQKLLPFPDLPKIEVLELADNEIEGGLEALAGLKSLHLLVLGGNPLSLAALSPLAALSGLQELDVLDCPCEEEEGFRAKMYELLPALVVLNGQDKEGNDVLDEEAFEEYEGSEMVSDEEEEDEDGEDNETEVSEAGTEDENEKKAPKVGSVDLKSWYAEDAKDEDGDAEYVAEVGQVGKRKPSERDSSAAKRAKAA